MKIQFPDLDKMIDFEMELNDKGLLGNYSSHTSILTFEKDRYTKDENKEETNKKIFNVARKHGGQITEL